MAALAPRWYVRGTDETHAYDRKTPVVDRGTSFCLTCVVVHSDPVGKEWHIEGPDVDRMMCGLLIDVDEGEVRVRPGKNLCKRCVKESEA